MVTAVSWKRFVDAIVQLHFPQTPTAFWTRFEYRYDSKIIWRTIWFTATECVCYTVMITSLSLPWKVFLGKLTDIPLTVSRLLFYYKFVFIHSCLAEKVTIAVFNPVTFKMITEVAFELNDTVVDVALEQKSTDGDIVLAISQKISGIWIYGFDGSNFHFKQV